ncbi:MAG: hypothetical protein BWY60_00083 [Actinobacteria bacterium ADurb.Bin346]|nr:MAG: hypothetical protein BWY60_00083 [Actinobacteria bacterium ADurb.Bin346]
MLQPPFNTPWLPRILDSNVFMLPSRFAAFLSGNLYASIFASFFAGLFLRSAVQPLISKEPDTTAPLGGVSIFMVKPEESGVLKSLYALP